jgi:hypothetical protein
MENRKIETCEHELMDVIGVAASTVYDLDTEEAREFRNGTSDISFMSLVAEISSRVVDHLTGREKIDEVFLTEAKAIREMYADLVEGGTL